MTTLKAATATDREESQLYSRVNLKPTSDKRMNTSNNIQSLRQDLTIDLEVLHIYFCETDDFLREGRYWSLLKQSFSVGIDRLRIGEDIS